MAGRTVRVQGFPAELPPDRAADKLTIHFLRSRNGGGDIANVRVLPGSLPCALITFEAPEVAQRILKVKNHVLAIGKTQYPLEVTPHAAELSPNEIFIHVSMTIDYGKLPTGKTLLKDLHKDYSNIQFSFNSQNMQCIVQGPFTELQTFSRDLLGSLNLKREATSQTHLPDSSCGAKEMEMPDPQQVPDSTESAQEAAKLPNWDQEMHEMTAKASSPQSPVDEEAVELLGKLEDFSLAMDSDIYLYMQRFCAAEYQGVLQQHHVDVVDVSGDGIAVLYLQPSAGVSGDTDALRQAQLALQQLYQQLEESLCKEKIAKEGLGMDSQALRALTSELQKLYPQLLCHEDVKQLYLVGSLVDVSKAKQFLEDSVTRRDAAHTVDTPSSSQPSGTTEPALDLPKDPVHTSPTRLSPSKPEMKGCKPSASRPVLRRSNSFSLPRPKEGSISGDISRVREEMSLDTLQWLYLKDVCHATLEELCTAGGVQISERHAGDYTVLMLQADDRRRLLQAKWKMEDLVQKCPDLVCQSVSYSELAVSGPDDSDLGELCSLLRGKSFQVGLSKDKYKLYLACPKEMLPGVTEAFHMFSSRRLCAMRSSLSPGAESTGKSIVIQPSRTQDLVLDAAFPGTLNSLQHLNIIDKVQSTDVLRASWLPEAEEKRFPSPWRFQQAWGQEQAWGYMDSGPGRRGSSLVNLGDKPSPGLRELQEQWKTKVALGEPESTQLKQILPDRFQFARDKSRGGHNEAMGQQHCPVPAADEVPHILPTWLSRAELPPAVPQQAPAAEPMDQGRAQLPGVRSNEQDEPGFPSQQRDPSLGQESIIIPLEQCEACQVSGVTCQGCCGHALCRTCSAADTMQPACCESSSAVPSNILGTLKISSLPQSLPGYYQNSTLQLAYYIPDGVQGAGDPRPGYPYKGGNFCAFLPENKEGLKIAKLLKEAFECGLTFQIKSCNGEEIVTWGPIPHKTSWDGGKARNGYPDAQYLHEVGTILNKLGLV